MPRWFGLGRVSFVISVASHLQHEPNRYLNPSVAFASPSITRRPNGSARREPSNLGMSHDQCRMLEAPRLSDQARWSPICIRARYISRNAAPLEARSRIAAKNPGHPKRDQPTTSKTLKVGSRASLYVYGCRMPP